MRQFAIDKGTPRYYALVKQDNMNGLQERLAGRDATIWVYEMLIEIAQRLLGVLAGLNRRYYSTAAEQARELTREIVAQVDEHMPQVDASRAHARIDVQLQAWKL